jgi:hypothetical protein
MSEIQSAIESFAAQLTALIEAQARTQARASVVAALGGDTPPRRGPGRPPKSKLMLAPVAVKARRKGPIQLCPVPYCRNPAAPVFGMVCGKHRDVSKAKIKKYREARKATKAAA